MRDGDRGREIGFTFPKLLLVSSSLPRPKARVLTVKGPGEIGNHKSVPSSVAGNAPRKNHR